MGILFVGYFIPCMYPLTFFHSLEEIEICGLQLGELKHPLFSYPWEIITWHKETIVQNSKFSAKGGSASGRKIQNVTSKFKNYKNQGGVFIGREVVIDQYVVFDTANGEIFIDDEAHIYPFAYIEGPCYVGAYCVVLPHAQIRKNTSIGHDCKIGGEVSGSIFQPYTNKAHHGFVGDSYIGSWVNLGAGTTTSNLKNTYGPVRVEYEGKRIDTGLQFLGCIMGDYVKTAINTSMYTGKIIGAYAQLFGCTRENVGSFVMDTHDGKKEFELDAALRAQARMFERRGKLQTDADKKFMSDVFGKTRDERKEEIE